jgi:hypothetical protein
LKTFGKRKASKRRERRLPGNSDFIEEKAGQRVEHSKIYKKAGEIPKITIKEIPVGDDVIPQQNPSVSWRFSFREHIKNRYRHPVGAGDIAIFAVGAVGESVFFTFMKIPEAFKGGACHLRSPEIPGGF